MQTIDLQRPRPSGRRPRAGHLMSLVALGLLAAIALSVWQAEQVADNRSRIAEADARVESARRAVQEFQQDNPEVSDNSDLREQIASLEAQRQTDIQRLRNLLQTSGVRAISYYDFLSTLANQRIDGAWLTRFRLENDEERGALYVTLRGLTEDTELLPDYLSGLRSGGLQSVSFNNLMVDRQPSAERQSAVPSGPLFSFQLSTETDPDALADATNDAATPQRGTEGNSPAAPAASRLPLDNLPPGILNSLMQGGGQ